MDRRKTADFKRGLTATKIGFSVRDRQVAYSKLETVVPNVESLVLPHSISEFGGSRRSSYHLMGAIGIF